MKKSYTLTNLIYLVLSITCMLLIFCLSAQPSYESQQESYDVGYFIGELFHPDFDEYTEVEKLEFAKKIDHPVRKTAHFIEYLVLGFLISGAYITRNKRSKLHFFVSWCVAVFYAATDEIHQLFVPGRSGQISDVVLDSCGALVGVLLYYLIVKLHIRKSRS